MNRTLLLWRREARELWRELLDAVLPGACALCRIPGVELCGGCRRNLVARCPMHAAQSYCQRCGEPLVPPRPDGRRVCRGRGRHRDLRGLRQLVAPYRFVGSGGQLVRRFKLDGDAVAGRWLARAMSDAFRLQGNVSGRPLVVSVPLHRKRRRERGFDQASWLADHVAERLGLRRVAGVLQRSRATRPQGQAELFSRERNVAGAFAVRDGREIVGRQVLLIDDVVTTGATLRACAGELRRAGCRGVSALTACRS